MRLISFDPLRTLTFPSHQYIKPEHFFLHKQTITEADFVLFPEYWQINALVFGLKAKIFPSLPSYLIGHNKIEMTRAFEAIAPSHTPYTKIAANTSSNATLIWEEMCLPFVAKLPKSSQGVGVFLIEDHIQWRDYLLLTDTIYVQEYLPIDRDLRVVWIGSDIVGSYWRLQSPNGFHNNIARGGQMMAGPVPEAAAQLVRHVATNLGIDHAGFDIAMVGDHPYLLEFNRIFGTQGVTALTGDLTPRIIEYLRSQLPTHKPRTPPGSAKNSNGRRRRLKRVA